MFMYSYQINCILLFVYHCDDAKTKNPANPYLQGVLSELALFG